MGRTLLLSSTRVTPQKLNNTGFSFGYTTIESALNDLL
jgi:NAD dependent epimerase/dehydratase family enzyme